MIKREYYLNRVIHHMWNGKVKVITGIHRCGKSVLLFDLFYEYLLSQGVHEEHVIKIELDQRRYYKFRNPITLCEYVESLVAEKKNEKFYLFIDEIQLTTKVIDKENVGIEVTIYDMLNELKAYKNLDVYVTGSNSKGLSSDIATEFRGRATQIHIFPLSFDEFYSHAGGDERKALDTYVLFGGMPRLLALTDEKDLLSPDKDTFMQDAVQLPLKGCAVSVCHATNLKSCGLFCLSSIVARISFSVGISIIPTAVKFTESQAASI